MAVIGAIMTIPILPANALSITWEIMVIFKNPTTGVFWAINRMIKTPP